MTIWRVYKHKCRFKHNIKDAPWLEDRSCLIPHEHGFAPNPLCIIEFIVDTGPNIIDFKKIKQIAIKCIKVIANKVIEEEKEDENDNLIQPWYYDFGTVTTEQLIDDLRKLTIAEFRTQGFPNARVQLWIDETRKYSVWDDGSA